MTPVRPGHGGVGLEADVRAVRADHDLGVPADLAGLPVPGDHPIAAVALPLPRGLDVLQPAEVEHLVLEGQRAHRRVVDRGGHLDHLLQDRVGHRRQQPLQT